MCGLIFTEESTFGTFLYVANRFLPLLTPLTTPLFTSAPVSTAAVTVDVIADAILDAKLSRADCAVAAFALLGLLGSAVAPLLSNEGKPSAKCIRSSGDIE